MNKIISRHFTKEGAQAKANKLNGELVRGRSSGWLHLDYVVKATNKPFRKWCVKARER